MKDKNRLSWATKLRLCWDVLTKGQYDPRDYKTINEQEAWDRCEQMRKELESTHRPRRAFVHSDENFEQ